MPTIICDISARNATTSFPAAPQPVTIRARSLEAMDDVDSLLREMFDGDVEVCASPLTGERQDLFPEERAAVAKAVDKRVRDFATGRMCARRLLSRFGLREAILPVASDGRPIWPAGFVGSISHAADLCVVAVARQEQVASIGIDVEIDHDLEERTWPLVCTPAEAQWIASQAATRRASLVTALFSAKEAVHKCTALSGQSFEPRRISIEWNGTSRLFHAFVDGFPNRKVTGRIARRQGWVFSAMQLRAG
jgi:4'-phosphopantetheinyl transferase EntD